MGGCFSLTPVPASRGGSQNDFPQTMCFHLPESIHLETWRTSFFKRLEWNRYSNRYLKRDDHPGEVSRLLATLHGVVTVSAMGTIDLADGNSTNPNGPRDGFCQIDLNCPPYPEHASKL